MTNYLNFSLSDHFFLSFNPEGEFRKVWNSWIKILFFQHLKNILALLQGLDEKSVFIQTDGRYCCPFPLVAFKVFSLFLVFQNWIIMGLDLDWFICLWFALLLRSLGLSFHQIWGNFRPYFFRYSFSFLFTIWDCNDPFFFFFFLIFLQIAKVLFSFFFFLGWGPVFSLLFTLGEFYSYSSSSLILSSVISTILLTPSTEFLKVSVIIFFSYKSSI